MSRRRFGRRTKHKNKKKEWSPRVESVQLSRRSKPKQTSSQVSAHQVYDVAEEIFKGLYWCIGDETDSTPPPESGTD